MVIISGTISAIVNTTFFTYSEEFLYSEFKVFFFFNRSFA